MYHLESLYIVRQRIHYILFAINDVKRITARSLYGISIKFDELTDYLKIHVVHTTRRRKMDIRTTIDTHVKLLSHWYNEE